MQRSGLVQTPLSKLCLTAKVRAPLKTKLREFVRYWMPAFAWMFVIFAASSDAMSAQHTSSLLAPFLRWLTPDITPATLAAVQFGIRKAAHVTEYAILAMLLVRAFRKGNAKGSWSYCAMALAAAAGYAALDEFHQTFVVSRTGSPRDVLIDTCGAALGLAICWVLAQRRKTPVLAA